MYGQFANVYMNDTALATSLLSVSATEGDGEEEEEQLAAPSRKSTKEAERRSAEVLT